MLTLGVRYLNGWALATHPADRERPEWPPHPDRVFMALAAAHFETREDPPTPEQEEERRALEWLENLAAGEEPIFPRIEASGHFERTAVTTFVPVNDDPRPVSGSGKQQKPLMPSGSLPVGRTRQPRQFPVAVPEVPAVHLVWEMTPPPELLGALDRLCRKVTSIGHSASLVQMWAQDGGVAPATDRPEEDAAPGRRTLRPVGGRSARYRLRVTAPGRLADLEARHGAGLRPNPSLWCGYEVGTEEPAPTPAAGTCFRPELLILRRVEGPALGLESTLQVIAALRNTVISHCPEPVPEWVSGHRSDRTPSEEDHLAFLPLANVGHEHADGRLLGLALAMPRSVPEGEQARCLREVLYDEVGGPKPIELRMGRLGLWQVEVEERESRPWGLRSGVWTAATPAASGPHEAAHRWATVTPIALDRHPKLTAEEKTALADLPPPQRKARRQALTAARMEEMIEAMCRRIGLPRPLEVILSPVSLFVGAPHARSFPQLQRGKSGGRIYHTHAVLTFPEPVCGPVLLGAGRYRGYGLCRPLAGGAPP